MHECCRRKKQNSGSIASCPVEVCCRHALHACSFDSAGIPSTRRLPLPSAPRLWMRSKPLIPLDHITFQAFSLDSNSAATGHVVVLLQKCCFKITISREDIILRSMFCGALRGHSHPRRSKPLMSLVGLRRYISGHLNILFDNTRYFYPACRLSRL